MKKIVHFMEPAKRFPSDCLPPIEDYPSREALFDSINEWAACRGYAFTTGRSTIEKSGKLTVTYTCDRSCRQPTSSQKKKRKTTSRGTGCQFSVLAKESRDKNTWTLRHRQDAKFSIHNHEPSHDITAHPIHRRLSDEDQLTLARLSNVGVAPRHIRTYLRQYCNSVATQQDVYNCVADTRRKLWEGQNTIHALVNELDKEGFWSRMQFDANGRVTAVLFAHPDSLKYLQAYPDVLLLDCTYKTNKYGMPLLDMIGVDACQRSFCIAFAFLSGETDDDYAWALDRLRSLYDHHCDRLPSVVLTDRCLACMNAIETSFPTSASLLCLWHANKAVLRNCIQAFACRGPSVGSKSGTDDTTEAWEEFYGFWHQLMSSPNDVVFKERLSEFEKKYLPDHLIEVGYVRTTWLDPYKEKLVKAWVDQHSHFGNTATSRVEGIHALLKSYLQKSTLDLFEAWRAMKQALANQLSELKSNQARQQMRTPIELSGQLYSIVRGWVSHEALRKVEEQRKLIEKNPLPSPICSRAFRKSQGLPCVHELIALHERQGVLLLEHFHPHWHLQRDGEPQILLEPRQGLDSRLEGVSSSRKPKQSTRREPSAFEEVEKAKKAASKCSRCGGVGHTRVSRGCPSRFEELFGTVAEAPLSESAMELAVTATPPMLHNAHQVNTTVETEPEAHVIATVDVLGDARLGEVGPGSACEPHADQSPVLPDDAEAEATQFAQESNQKMSYDDPQAIYERYVAARTKWYAVQPAGSIKTNQQYRRAMGFPLRYDRASYDWCLDYKQMKRQCVTSKGPRDWTREEMMAYLDWSSAEDNRIDAMVLAELGANPMETSRRGVEHIWKQIDEDSREQEAIYGANQGTEDCIVVRP
jgi:hypothetical protein